MKKPIVFILGALVGAVIGASPTTISFFSWLNGGRHVSTHFDNAVITQLPFEGDWLISWGGENKEDNEPHWGYHPQDLALDIRKVIDGGGGRTMKGDAKRNENYGCWAQSIYSPVDGLVVVAVDGVPDNDPGELNNLSALGNYVIVRDEKGFFVVMCHFKKGSVEVMAGQAVKVGYRIALCGNSGRSTEPHLHMHVQSGFVMAKSVALRMIFPSIVVSGNLKTNYSPKRGDVVSRVP